MNDFTTMIASDDEHEKVFAEIYYKDKFVALVSQEAGLNRLNIEFAGSGLEESLIARQVDLIGFQQALISAEKRLAGEEPH